MLSQLFRRWFRPADIKIPARNLSPVEECLHASATDSDPTPASTSDESEYQRRLAEERAAYADIGNIHDLPEIYHYWSNAYLLPILQEFGCDSPEDYLALNLFKAAQRSGSVCPRFISLGAGNCDAEVRIARSLLDRGLTRFTLECLDINPATLARGQAMADEAGLSEFVLPRMQDLNQWAPLGEYDGVMANQSLHHILELETVFDAVHAALRGPESVFVISDMIGRNGHQRWPEARALLQPFWQEMPLKNRYNVQLNRLEEEFMDWDCSVEGFEGIRAQDILPLLLERFGFEEFIAFANIIDPFIDRGFGHHFKFDSVADRAFIDRIHAADEAAMQAGSIKPTHMIATLRKQREINCRFRGALSPAASVRVPDPVATEPALSEPAVAS